MFVKSTDILMGALIRLLESTNWSLRGATVSLTKTSFPQKTETLRCGHSKGTHAHSIDLVSLLYFTLRSTLKIRIQNTRKPLRGKIATFFIFQHFLLSAFS